MSHEKCAGPEVIKPISCSTQLSMKFKLRINVKIVESKKFSCLNDKSKLFILLINVKMSITVE